MGQRLGEYYGYRKVGHTGTFDGGSAVLAHYPEVGLSIAVVTNTRGAGTPHALSVEARVAALLLGKTEEPARPLAVPDLVRSQIEGRYHKGRTQDEARVLGRELVVLQAGKELARRDYAGGLTFVDPKRSQVREWFVLDGEKAGWWMVASNGFMMEVFRRVPE